MTDESERNAMEADRLLNQEPLLDKALLAMEAAVIDRMIAPDCTDHQRLEGALAVNIIRDFKNVLRSYIRSAESEVAAQKRNKGFI
jgi:hypothetical protein